MQLTGTTYFHIAKNDPRDFLDIEIGDSKQKKFYPQVKMKRWDNEVNLSLRLKHEEKTPIISDNLDSGKVSWKGENIECNFYELPISQENEEGGFEFDIVLLQKPKSNKIEFSIESKGLKFERQPPLTEEYSIGWNEFFGANIKSVSECYVITENNDIVVYRPPEIVNSYAMYFDGNPINWKNKKLYRAGKFGHLPRSRVYDSVGNCAWTELVINGNNLSVILPQDFLDNAVYPIRNAAGLTFGYTTVGSTTESPGAACSWVYYSPSTPTSNGILTNLVYYVWKSSGSGTVYPALYSDNASSPNALLAGVYGSGGETYDTTPKWVTMTLSYANITSGTQYWLSAMCNNNWSEKYDFGTNPDYQYRASSPWFPNPWSGSAGAANKKYSFYAIYTESLSIVLQVNYPDQFFQKNEIVGY